MLIAEYDDDLGSARAAEMCEKPQAIHQHVQYLFGRPLRQPELFGRFAAEYRNHTALTPKTTLNVQWFPGATLFIFADAIRVFSRMTQRRAIQFTGERATNITH